MFKAVDIMFRAVKLQIKISFDNNSGIILNIFSFFSSLKNWLQPSWTSLNKYRSREINSLQAEEIFKDFTYLLTYLRTCTYLIHCHWKIFTSDTNINTCLAFLTGKESIIKATKHLLPKSWSFSHIYPIALRMAKISLCSFDSSECNRAK